MRWGRGRREYLAANEFAGAGSTGGAPGIGVGGRRGRAVTRDAQKPSRFKEGEMVRRAVNQFRAHNSDPILMGRSEAAYDALRIYPPNTCGSSSRYRRRRITEKQAMRSRGNPRHLIACRANAVIPPRSTPPASDWHTSSTSAYNRHPLGCPTSSNPCAYRARTVRRTVPASTLR
jgi:hypothetical protein